MNAFIGIGRIVSVESNDKVMRFTFSVEQEKPCEIPCVIFYPNQVAKEHMEKLLHSKQLVWLQGRIVTSEYESHGKKYRNVEVVAYVSGIKAI